MKVMLIKLINTIQEAAGTSEPRITLSWTNCTSGVRMGQKKDQQRLMQSFFLL